MNQEGDRAGVAGVAGVVSGPYPDFLKSPLGLEEHPQHPQPPQTLSSAKQRNSHVH